MSDKRDREPLASREQPENADRKAYQKPRIIHEMDLETRAGTTLSDPAGVLDLTGTGGEE